MVTPQDTSWFSSLSG
ncbi:hypothetical protein Taro_054718 [Colocasia esculenta]|uniref:Uncharacterized protein n=1 Tax=Colocasia esculenta TaxID=4460 RepID=A0A843XPG0_COLES|nr:hypothetical protein [Colocasia esculenta]